MKFIDSSVWLAYFFDASDSTKEVIESQDILFTSILSLFEVKKRAIKLKISEDKINSALQTIRLRSIIVHLNFENVDAAVAISLQNNLAAVDSLIYTSARLVKAILVTCDNDFRGLQDAVIIAP